jgi:hypothetical protein
MSANSEQDTPRFGVQVSKATALGRLLLFPSLAVAIGFLLVAGVANANDPLLSELEAAEAEMMERLEEAQQLEEEALRRVAEGEAAEQAEKAAARKAIEDKKAAEARARARKLHQQIAEEEDLEDVMALREERNEAAIQREFLGAHDTDGVFEEVLILTDPRSSPETPKIRDLPRSIFEESKVTIPAQEWGNRKKLSVIKLVLDADRDGNPEVVRYLDAKTLELIHQQVDRNYDGNLDAESDMDGGAIVSLTIDSNDDGRPDTWEEYARGRMVKNEIDRDYDGVVDAFYHYEGNFLSRERHDANNDGKVDLIIVYREGHRDKAEEDRDRDGRSDTWTRYGIVQGLETVIRIERDQKGRGYADTFESFEAHEGKAVISRREEDIDGDGEVDMVSIYRLGKLVRREILKPEVIAL